MSRSESVAFSDLISDKVGNWRHDKHRYRSDQHDKGLNPLAADKGELARTVVMAGNRAEESQKDDGEDSSPLPAEAVDSAAENARKRGEHPPLLSGRWPNPL